MINVSINMAGTMIEQRMAAMGSQLISASCGKSIVTNIHTLR